MPRRNGSSSRASRQPKKKSVETLLSPLQVASDDESTPKFKHFDFDFNLPKSSSKKKAFTSSPILHPSVSPNPPLGTSSKISGLRDLASSRANALKRSLDLSHSEVLKEFESSKTRIAKRFKMQTQACLQLSDEAEKEYKKISDRIHENTDLLKSSYLELINEAQASASRVCKVSIPELSQSLEKAIDGLRKRYKTSTSPV